jgi:hypothetical protein
MTAFAGMLHWVAFGGGEREFTSSTSIGGLTFSAGSSTSELPGRIFFGLFAIPLDVLAAWCWWYWLKTALGWDWKEKSKSRGKST